MAKRWDLVARADYFHSLRQVFDADRYELVMAIWGRLEETDDPTAGADPDPETPGRYTFVVGKYLITFEVPDPLGSMIKLLPITTID